MHRKERLLRVEPHPFPDLSQSQLQFYFLELSRANFIKMTRAIIALVLSFHNLLRYKIKMAALNEAFLQESSTFKIAGFSSYQKLAIQKFVIQKQHVLVNLPTGSGKYAIYQALPIVFGSIFKGQGHIVVVVSPLISLIEDQINNLRGLGLSAVNISDPEVDSLRVEKGEYSIVYSSPEAWLTNVGEPC